MTRIGILTDLILTTNQLLCVTHYQTVKPSKPFPKIIKTHTDVKLSLDNLSADRQLKQKCITELFKICVWREEHQLSCTSPFVYNTPHKLDHSRDDTDLRRVHNKYSQTRYSD